MSDADKVFREDPWEGIDNPEASRRLYEKDKRFWVSVDEESTSKSLEKIKKSSGISRYKGWGC